MLRFLLGWLFGSLLLPRLVEARPPARLPQVQQQLHADPATHTFICRYALALPAADSATVLHLNLSRELRVQLPAGSAIRVRRVYYPYFGDTVQQLTLRVPAHRPRRLAFTYAGTLGARFATADGLELSGHSNWLPFQPGGEYEEVAYDLTVQVPAGYRVRSTAPAHRQRPGCTTFTGRAGAIELTALVAREFADATTATAPYVTVCKTGAALLPADSALLRAQTIISFYNRTLGQQDPVRHFRLLLPGTDRDAFALLDNAAVITYRDFNLAQRGDLLVLAQEISHRWWTHGSVHTADDWLNQAFATYSSLLYLQAQGDTSGYRTEYAKRAATVAGTPPLLGFDRTRYELGMYRRVIYNKGTVVLAALHARVGTALFHRILAITAGHRTATTTDFLIIVGEVAGPDTRAWLLAELRR